MRIDQAVMIMTYGRSHAHNEPSLDQDLMHPSGRPTEHWAYVFFFAMKWHEQGSRCTYYVQLLQIAV
jgi:hypothetical protein